MRRKRKTEAKTEAVIYARFSPRPKKSATRCESIETQFEYCEQYCRMMGLKVVAKFRDDLKSGKAMDGREGLEKALDDACKRGCVLVVYSLSRLARSIPDAFSIADKLNKHDVDLVSLHEKIDTLSATGRFVYAVFAALAALERELTAERTSDAMLRHQLSGRRMSDRCPYGWMEDPNSPLSAEGSRRVGMIEDPAEQEVVRYILAEHAAEAGLREIGRRLEAKGIKCRGGRWIHTTIARIISREGPRARSHMGQSDQELVAPDHA
jgi:site-specific DNA recombinase